VSTATTTQYRTRALVLRDGLRLTVVAFPPDEEGPGSAQLTLATGTSHLQQSIVGMTRDDLAGLADRLTEVLNVMDAQESQA
jgi:hypothetical protein